MKTYQGARVPSERPRVFTAETLAQMCVCGFRRREHSGHRFNGSCPGSRYGDARRFRNANPSAPVVKRHRPSLKAFPSGGPWRILEDCPAVAHNTSRAAESGRSGGAKCVCPRAVALREERLRRWRASGTSKDNPVVKLSAVNPVPVGKRIPDLSAGACQRPWNVRIANGGFSVQPTKHGRDLRAAAKSLCATCPVLKQCREYVTGQERPAGAWGGVWGGLDPWNRKGKEMIITPDDTPRLVPYVPA